MDDPSSTGHRHTRPGLATFADIIRNFDTINWQSDPLSGYQLCLPY
jgi:hypothetical protein